MHCFLNLANPHHFAGNVNEDRSIIIEEYGGSITLFSLIQLGTLLQAYNVTWLFNDSKLPPSEDYRVGLTHDLLSSLIISNVQEDHLGAYACIVTVTNPYDGEMWSINSNYNLGKA